MSWARAQAPGLLASFIVALAATFLSEHYGASAMLFALLLGMAVNFLSTEGRCAPGIALASRSLLRIGVALLGMRITLAQIEDSGWVVLTIVVVSVIATIAFGVLCARWCGFNRQFGLLTGGAVGICGASAALAIAAVLPQHEKKERAVIFTVVGVSALSTVAMVLYPIIARTLGLDERLTGIFFGSTIHDVAQVVGAGYSVSQEAGDAAVVSKLLRVALLLPVVSVVALAVRYRAPGSHPHARVAPLPGFLVAFVVLVVLASLGVIPKAAGSLLNEIARGCLVVAIAAVGLKTSPLELRKVGARAALLLGIETLFLATFVALADRFA